MLEWMAVGSILIGLLLLLADLLGGFRDADGIRLYESLRDDNQVPCEAAKCAEFLRYLGIPPPSQGAKLMRKGPSWDQLRGDSVLLTLPNESPKPVAHIETVRTWAFRESPAYRWASFGLLAVGFLGEFGLKVLGQAPARWG